MPRRPLRHFRLSLMAFAALLLVHTAAAQDVQGRDGRRPDHPPRLRAGVRVLDSPTLDALTHSPEGHTLSRLDRRFRHSRETLGSASARALQIPAA
jgi:hypothetical protein